MKAAKARNPLIKTYGLSWGAPGWINNGTGFFGPEMVAYQTAWVECMRQEGISMDYLGVWNERYWGGPDYVKALRAGLDAKGFYATQIIIPDGGYDKSIMADAAQDPIFNASFAGVGLHYPCNVEAPEVQEGGKLYWASEDWWDQPDWDGAQSWGRLLSQNYVRMNMTTTISWSPLWAVYDQLPDEQAGLFLANEPWSGHWEVSPPIWAGAHHTQFTQVGWRYLSVPSGGSGVLPMGGSYVSLVPPAGEPAGLTIVLETLRGSRCSTSGASGTQSVVFKVAEGGEGTLPPLGTPLQVWSTNVTHQFIRLEDTAIDATTGTFTVTIPIETIITVSTVTGAQKGSPAKVNPIPPSASFPFPYSDDFSATPEDTPGRFWADQYGSWAVRGGWLTQVAPGKPSPNQWSGDLDPLTLLGSTAWVNYSVSVDTKVPPPPAALPLIGSGDGAPAQLLPCDRTAPAQVWTLDSPSKGYLSNAPKGAPSQQCFNVYGCDTKLVYWSCVTQGGSCCGADCYDGLVWSFQGNHLVSALPGGHCATVAAPFSPTSALTLAPCMGASAANQSWVYSSTTGLLELAGSGLCLSQLPPPPPPVPYSKLCGRLSKFNGFDLRDPISAYCLQAYGNGTWQLTGAGKALAQGNYTAGGGPGSTLAMALSFNGPQVEATLGTSKVASVTDTTLSNGRVALGSSFGFGAFDNFKVQGV